MRGVVLGHAYCVQCQRTDDHHQSISQGRCIVWRRKKEKKNYMTCVMLIVVFATLHYES
jgi:hypothetical protein